MTTTWTVDSNQSDVLIKMRHSIIAYIAGTVNKFSGSIDIDDNQILNAKIDFNLDVNNINNKVELIDTSMKLNDLFDINEYPIISFKSISFEKVNSDINFLKGYLTIKNITKVVELDAAFLGITNYDGTNKAAFEVVGQINRKDFGLSYNTFAQTGGIAVGQYINLIANLEFTS
ncbi:MAG: YceI family protein [Flavobacteriaceae bacterium]|jgi:polyisoprenoid-binding protein YceI|uniref:YceI family protein n=1 Tax=Flavobacterium kayseriense TaxID=2764714 RepID=A0ABR7J5A4_9FLAO|nr:YceI family protein [Flavobacterium kayseriense]MBC5840716.1 YceI family protein [Flavobacterium kayseriense]MBC5846614.1 YceI family protein [Flavobacterium kayseriense]MBU0941047.1 YceI family protein [Bacteroidota bacterium]MBX9888692.1 YceI family protein [Flavobacteriaceae bacterium]